MQNIPLMAAGRHLLAIPVWITLGVAAMLVFAPLWRAGKTADALMVLELMGVVLLLLILFGAAALRPLSPLAKGGLLLVSLLPLLYLIPLPLGIWTDLPGREVYRQVIGWLQATGDESLYLTASLIPLRSLSAWLGLLPVLAVFLAVVKLDEKRVRFLLLVFLGVALGQAVLGYLQYFLQDPAFYFNMITKSVQGTYLNRNHYVALIYMALPLVLALSAYAFLLARYWLAGVGVVLGLALLAVAVLTQSRTGIALAGLGSLLLVWVVGPFDQRLRQLRNLSLVAVGAGFALVFALSERFSLEKIQGDLRWSMFEDTWRGLVMFFPVGSGPGTYPQVYRRFQPADAAEEGGRQVGFFINHAHNDYLELVFETGLLGAAGLAVFLLLFMGVVWSVLRHRECTLTWFTEVGAGIGCGLLLLHGLLSYNFHTPANAVFFAFLLALFLRRWLVRQEQVTQSVAT